MAGIYLHVPFCKRRCIYCDFYSTTSNHLQQAYAQALCRELERRRDFLPSRAVDTVYFGGGTPSQLPVPLLAEVLRTIQGLYCLSATAEVTLEANPDDISEEWLQQVCLLPVNRLSLGIQTFDEEQLRFLRRRHTGEQARQAVRMCRRAGFENLSIDLIYGLPGQTLQQWQHDLETALQLEVQHISAYALIYEEGTPLWELRRAGCVQEVAEEDSLALFDCLMDTLEAQGFEHYEISNFARPGYESRHNSSYWKGEPYLGCGPSAHSFREGRRQWNTPDLSCYLTAMEAIGQGREPASPWFEYEDLSRNERYNDRIITGLRTCWGVDLHRLSRDFGAEAVRYCLQMAAPHLRQGTLQCLPPSDAAPEGILKLTRKGIFVSDGIMSDLLQVDA